MAGQFVRHYRRIIERIMLPAVCLAGLTPVQQGKAQLLAAPFVFEGQVLQIDAPAWQAGEHYLVAEPAYISVAPGLLARIDAPIAAVPGSPHGVVKLGAGALSLAGANSYRGSTQLLQGELQVDGAQVFSDWGGVEAVRGTRLSYAPGVEVSQPLKLLDQDAADLAPGGLYVAVAPLAGLEEAVAWQVPSGQARHTGLLQGALAFVKQGAGTLDIRGDAMAYTGTARVQEGALAINEVFGGAVQVMAGARVQGEGLMGAAHIQTGGVLAPGNSIGTLRVAGDLLFDAGSRLEVQALPGGEADLVMVGGQARLDGEVAVLAAQGVWADKTSYPILTAQGGLAGTQFASVRADLAYLTPSLSYTDDAVLLTLARNEVGIGAVGGSPDEQALGAVVEEEVAPRTDGPGAPAGDPGQTDMGQTDIALTDTGGGDAQPPPQKAHPELYEAVVVLEHEAARRALRELGASGHASVLSGVWDDSRFMREAVLKQGQQARPMRVEQPWAQAYYADGSRDAQEGAAADARHLQGLLIGAAALARAGFLVGGFIGLQDARLVAKEVKSNVHVATTYLGAYLAAEWKQLLVTTGWAHSRHALRSRRSVEAGQLLDELKASFKGRSWQWFGEAAMPLPLGARDEPVSEPEAEANEAGREAAGALADGVEAQKQLNRLEKRPVPAPDGAMLTPFVRLAWVDTRLGGYEESGGPAALRVEPARLAGWLASVGVRAQAVLSSPLQGVSEVVLQGQVAMHRGWAGKALSRQAFADSLTQTRFESQGLGPMRQAAGLDLEIRARLKGGGELGVGYQRLAGRGLRDQGLNAWVKVVF